MPEAIKNIASIPVALRQPAFRSILEKTKYPFIIGSFQVHGTRERLILFVPFDSHL
jgi:hypothetical protein